VNIDIFIPELLGSSRLSKMHLKKNNKKRLDNYKLSNEEFLSKIF
jgi:hypothetical protein